ncbi:TetR/AcrR family transcriptional regulator [Jannaschia sp. CCS1]|uniref:TetR/AcrR family transcriptional regulator n=1 Tax=Jannaschia sp. (strain CCS1) TaxID=290400 RepID=UPI000053B3E8|nr:TetR/AcrR family transcriptional regulator [Jannaschia sp. CCS1]ABD53014.1 transcriptional regulator, TetR family [Jannaschia sp. CCS1]
MPRPRLFDPDTALDALVGVFWAKGYSDASYDDIVSASGVSRKSLYAAFGDKQALFTKALQRYRTDHATRFLADLDNEDISLDGIASMFRRLGELATSDAGSMGCLMANTATSPAIKTPEVKDQLDRHLEITTKRFSTALARAGCPAKRIKAKALYLTGALQGLFLLAHARAQPDLIEAYVNGVVDQIA